MSSDCLAAADSEAGPSATRRKWAGLAVLAAALLSITALRRVADEDAARPPS